MEHQELMLLDVLRAHLSATENLEGAWLNWVLGHTTDQEFAGWRDEWQASYHAVCEEAQKAQEAHIEARRATRARYLAEQGATEPSPLTPYGEGLEAVKAAIEAAAEAAGQENTTIARLVTEAIGEVAELYRRKAEAREENSRLFHGRLTERQLQRCGCKDCRAELQRRIKSGSVPATPENVAAATIAPDQPSPSGKSSLLHAVLQAMAERQGLKATQVGPALWGLYTEPLNPPSTPANPVDYKGMNGAGPGGGIDPQAGHDDWPYGPMRSIREAPPDNDGNGYFNFPF
jgi:hypothetical protein